MKNKVLITGASGFVGSFLVEEALQKGWEVYAGIRKSSNKQFLQHPQIHFFELNFSSATLLTEQFTAFKKEQGSFDYVIHNAGITQADKKEDFFTVNCNYTKNLLHALKDADMQIKKFVFISSLAAYGPGNAETFAPIELGHQQLPISAYGKSKLNAEEFIRLVDIFPFLIINPTAVYGPRDKDFLQFVKLINKGFEPYIGSHKQMVSMIYVKDLTKAVIGLAASSAVNVSYIVSDGVDYKKESIGENIKQILKKRTLSIKIPLLLMQILVAFTEKLHLFFLNKLPFLSTDKLNEISSANWLCDSTALWKDLHTTPGYSLKEGLQETIQWYIENKWL